MNRTKLKKAKKFLLRKRMIIPVILLILIAAFSLSSGNDTNAISVLTPTKGDLTLSVRATGQVTSKIDLSLAFTKAGTVKSVKVAVGDAVKAGQVLATLSGDAELASLTQARGALLAAQARLKRTLEGATSEEVALAQVNLDQTRQTQETLVRNAYQTLLNSTPEAVPENGTNNYTPPTISGTYNGTKEGDIHIDVYRSDSGIGYNLSGLVNGSGIGNTITPQPLGASGLSIKFPEDASTNLIDWVIHIPNKSASNYLANYNAYQSALSNKQSLIDQRTAELNLKKAQARQSDVDLARADVTSAEGGVQAAGARYEDTIIRSPSEGTVTKVDIKYGELADTQKTAIIVEDVGNLYIESDINESSIAEVKLGQAVSINLDAFADERKFTGSVVEIDPSSMTTEGVVNYRIKVSINEKDPAIRPGMNAEIVILVNTKQNTLAVPKAAVIIENGKSYVNVVTNEKRKKYAKQEVSVSGFIGDGNMMEITGGLSADEKVALVSLK